VREEKHSLWPGWTCCCMQDLLMQICAAEASHKCVCLSLLSTLWTIKMSPFHYSNNSVKNQPRVSQVLQRYDINILAYFYWDTVLELSQNTTYKFYQTVWRHYSGKLGNITTLRLQKSLIQIPVIMKVVSFWQSYSKHKRTMFCGSQCIYICSP